MQMLDGIARRCLALSIVLVGCAGQVARTETPIAAVAASPSVPDLGWLASADVVRIERAWGGLTGSWVAHYDLRRDGDAFVGLASLVTSGPGHASPETPMPSRTLRTSAIEIAVPVLAMESFLDALARAAPREPDAPGLVRVTASDDFPSWIIDVEAAAECAPAGRCAPSHVARFVSPATGDRPAPWHVVASDRFVEIEPRAPREACEALVPHLAEEALSAALR
jgi:hypothetical protein